LQFRCRGWDCSLHPFVCCLTHFKSRIKILLSCCWLFCGINIVYYILPGLNLLSTHHIISDDILPQIGCRGRGVNITRSAFDSESFGCNLCWTWRPLGLALPLLMHSPSSESR
jgi:hypothetical protein